MEDNINFKIIVLGDQGIFIAHSGVGKSSLINRYIKGEFSEQYNVTVGVEFASKMMVLDEKVTVRLQIWDTVGLA
jgi:GTPase SAR1 family protein